MVTRCCRYDKEGWYSRVENNSWRSIAFNMLPKPQQLDKEQSMSCEKGRDWHYSRLQRWQDREKKQRHRRIEWMQKLYRQARLENEAAQDSTDVSRKQPYAPPATGAGENPQLSDHNLPMRAAAAGDVDSIEWLSRAKSLKAGVCAPPPRVVVGINSVGSGRLHGGEQREAGVRVVDGQTFDCRRRRDRHGVRRR